MFILEISFYQIFSKIGILDDDNQTPITAGASQLRASNDKIY